MANFTETSAFNAVRRIEPDDFVNDSVINTTLQALVNRGKYLLDQLAQLQPVNTLLLAIAGLAANGFMARTGSGSAAARTLTGTAAQITVTNGDGVGGNPTFSLPNALTMTGKTLTGGTYSNITIGSVAAPVTVAQGGTGATTQAVALANLGGAARGANGDITSLSGLTTPLSIAQGGTGRSDGKVASLITARTIGSFGDVSWAASFDGSANATAAATLATLHGGGTVGGGLSIPIITFDGKGRITAASTAAINFGFTPLASYSTTSGTAYTCAIPAVCKRVTLILRDVSKTGDGSVIVEYSLNSGGSWDNLTGTGSTPSGNPQSAVIEVINPDGAAGSWLAVSHVWKASVNNGDGAKADTYAPSSRVTHIRIRTSAGTFNGGAAIFVGE